MKLQTVYKSEKLKIFLFLLLGIVAEISIGGYANSVLWEWYIAPLGVMQITPLHGAGIAITVKLIFGLNTSDFNEAIIAERPFKCLMEPIFGPLIMMMIGWIVHICM